MPRDEGIVIGLIRFWETGKAAVAAQSSESVAPSRNYLVRIALVSHIEHYPVNSAVIYPVQRDR